MKHGKCPFGHEGLLRQASDGRWRLCECGGGALYENGRLVGPKALVRLVEGLDRLANDLGFPVRSDN